MKTRSFLNWTRRLSLRYLALVLGSVFAFGLSVVAQSAVAGSATWKADPTSNDWNTAANWTPETVPNQVEDVATFGNSDVTDVSMPSFTNIAGITFAADASSYNIDVDFFLTGAGIINNSKLTQHITTSRGFGFAGTGTAGTDISYTINASSDLSEGVFQDESDAGTATFIINGSLSGDTGAVIAFLDRSSAGYSKIINSPPRGGNDGGETVFEDSSSAGYSTITIKSLAVVEFFDKATAANATFLNDGGTIYFEGNSDGGMARFHLLHGGVINVSGHSGAALVLGSLAGDGTVTVSSPQLGIGSNGLSTTFSGIIEEDGSGGRTAAVSKVGAGTLTLSGANTYTGGTTVSGGVLVANNRQGATGTGSVNVEAGTLGGRGIILGAVTVGTGSGSGAFLAPSVAGKQPLTLSCKSTVTFKSDSTYTCQLNSKIGQADHVAAKGVTIESGAQFDLETVGNKRLPSGTVFTVISNTSANPISGTFTNLADGAVISVGRNKLQASYEGGDGNDLTLTVQ